MVSRDNFATFALHHSADMTTEKKEKRAEFIRALSAWSDLRLPGSFSSIPYLKKGLAAAASSKKEGRQKPIVGLEKKLESLRDYQKMKNPTKTFPRRTFPAFYFGDRWEADLMDLERLGRRGGNPRRRHVLLAQDIFSRKIFTKCLPNKMAQTTAKAFSQILKELKHPYEKPRTLQTDCGNEFKGAFKTLLEKEGISHTFARNAVFKARYAERAGRSFKKVLLGHILTRGKPAKRQPWLKTVALATANLNSRFHRGIGMAPAEAPKRFKEIQEALVAEERRKQPSFRQVLKESNGNETFKVGDLVFAAKKRQKGEKESDLAWVTENPDETSEKKKKKKTGGGGGLQTPVVFRVADIMKERKPYLYKIVSKKGRPVARPYYAEELRSAGRKV